MPWASDMKIALTFVAAILAGAAGCAVSSDSPSDEGPGGESPDFDGGGVDTITPELHRGVDRASAFDVSEAHILHDKHGVAWTGVYIGGACDGGSGWTKAVVERLHEAVGWRFMPIYVGQQSPSICGAHALNYDQGKADGEHAAARMRAFGWHGNRAIPVALDVEAGTYEYSEHGSTEYVKGWVKAVHEAGFLAYVYSSPSGLVHFHDANIGVNAGWAASYFYDSFENLTPGDLHQLGNRFVHRNRAWQYAGDFEVSGVGRVDANTSRLLTAPAPGGTNMKKR